jgi:hypothetical protein
MLTFDEANNLLGVAEPLFSAQEIAETVKRMAEITAVLAHGPSSRPERYGRRGRIYGPPAALAGTHDLRLSPREPLREYGMEEINWKMSPQEDIRGESCWCWMTS